VAASEETLLSHYRLLRRIGVGGMGEVHLARDTRLGRTLAIKTLHDSGQTDPEQRRRLLQEAQAASALNHPNIVTVYDIGHDAAGDCDFIAMEYIDGEALAGRLERGACGVDAALRVGIPIASALAAAHDAGIVHRDLKPANVMLTTSGLVKLVDFGLAKQTTDAAAGPDDATRQAWPLTADGMALGTPAYMAPEQIEGRPIDARTDVFAFGLLLQEVLTGQRAFQAVTPMGLAGAILRDPPQPLQRGCPDCPPALARLVADCLQKEPSRRPATAGELLLRLQRIEADWRRRGGLLQRLRHPWVALPLVLALIVLGAVGGQRLLEQRGAQQLLEEGLAEIDRLAMADRTVDAWRLAHTLGERFPAHPVLRRWIDDLSFPAALRTDPPGAALRFKAYNDPDAEWIDFGVSDLADARVPHAHLRWQMEMEGYAPLQLASSIPPPPQRLLPLEDTPHGMVRVAAGASRQHWLPVEPVDAFWLDRTEVSNADYQAFVDADGYRRPEFWQEPIERDGRVLSFAEAMALFRDSTGRPGPAGWELGRHPEGAGLLPVTGVSWFEAAAYARFRGKALPSAWHWLRAAEPFNHSDVLLFGNFDSAGPVAVGSRAALSPFGNEDLAGNVAEWIDTAAGDRRMAFGGHWKSLAYMFGNVNAEDPFARVNYIGFRCALFDRPPPAHLAHAPPHSPHDYGAPADDEVFAALSRFYTYAPSRAPPELVEETEAPYWRLQVWQLPAEYRGESFRLRLYLPRSGTPPFQTVLYAPTGSAQMISDGALASTQEFAYLARTGRAVAVPVLFGTYERRLLPDASQAEQDSMRPNWRKDVGRVLDLVAEHPELDPGAIGFLGFSLGANYGVNLLATEPRLRVGVLQATGLFKRSLPPEVNPINFLPRVRQPVLLIGGRDDFINPLETSQRPLFERLTASAHKEHYIFEGGHVPPRQQEVIGVVLDWFDRQLGPVGNAPAPP
jgi:eukaryotic-like serine/threonine-protein kinase